MRSARTDSARTKDQNAGAAGSLVDQAGHRFPWPGGAAPRRYGLETPYLAIVNARGPWAVWKHDRANPPFIPLCLDLLGKEFWRRAGNDERVFALTCWMRAAQEDDWGIVWGDPVRLCTQWGLEPGTFTARLDWLIREGLACYLTAVEAEAVRSWRPTRFAGREGGSKRGEEQGQAESSKQGQAEQEQDPAGPAGSQDSSCSASARQIPGSEGRAEQSTGQESTAQESTAQQSKSQPEPQGQPQPREPANLPKSDDGAAGGSPRTSGGVRGRKTPGRPLSVSDGSRDAGNVSRLGDLLVWGNPAAVVYGRAMYEAITGRRLPEDLTAESDQVKGDVGVWVHYWAEEVEPALAMERRGEFAERCVRDVRKKLRSGRKPTNPGGLARARIVPGILAAMANAVSK
jgi:hypothetical protein